MNDLGPREKAGAGLNNAEGGGRAPVGSDRQSGEGVRQFTVRLELPSRVLAPNGSHGHWAAKARAVKSSREASAWLFAVAKPKDWKVAPVEIDVVYRHSRSSVGYRARDVQNGIAACKSLLDGMVDAGIVPSDSAKWLQWGRFELVTQADGTRDGVYITVRVQ